MEKGVEKKDVLEEKEITYAMLEKTARDNYPEDWFIKLDEALVVKNQLSRIQLDKFKRFGNEVLGFSDKQLSGLLEFVKTTFDGDPDNGFVRQRKA